MPEISLIAPGGKAAGPGAAPEGRKTEETPDGSTFAALLAMLVTQPPAPMVAPGAPGQPAEPEAGVTVASGGVGAASPALGMANLIQALPRLTALLQFQPPGVVASPESPPGTPGKLAPGPVPAAPVTQPGIPLVPVTLPQTRLAISLGSVPPAQLVSPTQLVSPAQLVPPAQLATATEQVTLTELATLTEQVTPAGATPLEAPAPRLGAAKGAPKSAPHGATPDWAGVAPPPAPAPGTAEATAAPADPAPLAAPVDVESLMAEVARTVRSRGDGAYSVTLRLHPEHLGEVRLHLTLAGQQVHTLFEVTNPEAGQALELRGQQLRSELHDAGLTLSGFQVNTGLGDRSQARRDLEQAFDAARRPGPDQARTEAGLEAVRRMTITIPRTGGIDTIA
jgi:flagellar hook-length control protein FliK